jgi:hypothetical protein
MSACTGVRAALPSPGMEPHLRCMSRVGAFTLIKNSDHWNQQHATPGAGTARVSFRPERTLNITFDTATETYSQVNLFGIDFAGDWYGDGDLPEPLASLKASILFATGACFTRPGTLGGSFCGTLGLRRRRNPDRGSP